MSSVERTSQKLKRIFIIFLALYFLNLVVPLIGLESYTQRMWLLANLAVTALSLFVLMKEGLPGKGPILTGLCLAILAGLVRPLSGLVTLVTFLAKTWSNRGFS